MKLLSEDTLRDAFVISIHLETIVTLPRTLGTEMSIYS